MPSASRVLRPRCRSPRESVRVATLVASLALVGCTVGPDYVRPSAPDAAAFRESPPVDGAWKTARPLSVDASGTFWNAFGDPTLDALIVQATTANQSVVQADANYRAAQATVRLSRAALFPTIGVSASESRARSAQSGTRTASVGSAHAAGFESSWEPDLWGSVRRSIEAAGATAQSTDANLAAVRLLIQSEIAADYLALRISDETSDLLARSVASYQTALKLTQSQLKAGTVSQSDVALATAQLKSTQTELTDVVATRAQLEHAIAVLAGRTPADYTLAKADLTAALPAPPVGLPSQLLERRPDIAQAERLAAAANADIGVAKAAYFPVLTLSASGGDSLASLGQFFTAPGRVWSLGASLAQVLFDGGARRAQTDRAVANYDAAVAAYRQTVLNGFQEVEDNLALLRVLESEQDTTDDAVAASRTAERIALSQYRAGTTTYLSVITAQNTALTNERTAVTLRGRRYAASVALIRAIGGGWNASQLRDPLAGTTTPPSTTVVADWTSPSR